LFTRQKQNDAALQQKAGKRQLSSVGQWRMSEIVRAQYDQLAADTERLRQLSAERKAEEIEKLARRIRSRLKGWF
jgi:ATP-dependent helicase/DNAse subunit B